MTPTYGEYRGASLLAGGAVSEFESDRERGFRWDLKEACRRITGTVTETVSQTVSGPRLVFLCNPNNPTGVYLEHEEVKALAQACTETTGAL